MFYLVTYVGRMTGKAHTMQIPADNQDEAQEKFVDYFEEECLPVPEIISIVRD